MKQKVYVYYWSRSNHAKAYRQCIDNNKIRLENMLNSDMLWSKNHKPEAWGSIIEFELNQNADVYNQTPNSLYKNEIQNLGGTIFSINQVALA